MRGMQKLESLSEIVGFSVADLCQIYEDANSDVHELMVWDPAKPLKPRPVIRVGGRLRKIQNRLQRRMKHEFKPSNCSHGGVSGRNIVSNVKPHLNNRFGFKVDIAAFFPSISSERVYAFFHLDLHCGHEVSKFLTRFCTYDFHLALGLITSPILADQILKRLDSRLENLSRTYGLTITRYIDDIMVSAKFNLRNTVVSSKILEILGQEQFKSNAEKCRDGRLEDKDFSITGLQIRNGRVDVQQEFLVELDRIIEDHRSLSLNGPFKGPYLSESQIAGKVNHVCWVVPSRRFSLCRQFRSIRWADVERNSKSQHLVFEKKVVCGRNVIPPQFITHRRNKETLIKGVIVHRIRQIPRDSFSSRQHSY